MPLPAEAAAPWTLGLSLCLRCAGASEQSVRKVEGRHGPLCLRSERSNITGRTVACRRKGRRLSQPAAAGQTAGPEGFPHVQTHPASGCVACCIGHMFRCQTYCDTVSHTADPTPHTAACTSARQLVSSSAAEPRRGQGLPCREAKAFGTDPSCMTPVTAHHCQLRAKQPPSTRLNPKKCRS